MLSDKKLAFLEKSLKTSVSEVLEEMDALCEGSDLEKSRKFIRNILQDLVHAVDHFDEIDLDEENVGPNHRFVIGDYVMIKNKLDCFYHWYASEIGLPEKFFRSPSELLGGENGVVIARFCDSESSIYAVKVERKCFLVSDEGLQFVGTGRFPFQFAVGDTVKVTNGKHSYLHFPEFASFVDIPQEELKIINPSNFCERVTGQNVMIRARGIHPSFNNVCYIVENDEGTFIIDEKGLASI